MLTQRYRLFVTFPSQALSANCLIPTHSTESLCHETSGLDVLPLGYVSNLSLVVWHAYIYIYICQTTKERERDRETDRQRDRQRHRHIERK